MSQPNLVHFTEGGPWHGYSNQKYSEAWAREFADMLGGKNPCSSGMCEAGDTFFRIEVKYEQKINL